MATVTVPLLALSDEAYGISDIWCKALPLLERFKGKHVFKVTGWWHILTPLTPQGRAPAALQPMKHWWTGLARLTVSPHSRGRAVAPRGRAGPGHRPPPRLRLLKVTKVSKPARRRVLAALIGGAPRGTWPAANGVSAPWRAGQGRAAAAGAELRGGEGRGPGLRGGEGPGPGLPAPRDGQRSGEAGCRGGEWRALSVRRSLSRCPSCRGSNGGRVGEPGGDGAGALPVRARRACPHTRPAASGVALAAAAGRGAWEPRPRELPPGCVLRMAMGSPGAPPARPWLAAGSIKVRHFREKTLPSVFRSHRQLEGVGSGLVSGRLRALLNSVFW